MIPFLTRRTESFGVSLPAELYDEPWLQKLRQEYLRMVLGLGTLLALLVLFALFQVKSQVGPMITSLGMSLQLGLMIIFYLRGHWRMKRIKAEKNWLDNYVQQVVVDTTFRQRQIRVSPIWFLAYILIILVTLALGLLFYPDMPGRVPVHYDYAGNVTEWAAKSFKVLLIAPLVQLFLTMLMFFIHWMIGQAKLQIDAANPEKSIEQNHKFRYRWSAFIVFAGLMLLGIFVVMQLTMVGVLKNSLILGGVIFLATLAFILAVIILAVTTGQGGSRLAVPAAKEGAIINRDDDRYWKWGMFYYHPDDPAIFVEKRFGIGWTNNFARPATWWMLAGFIGVALGIVLLTRYLAR
jgi:uncharacterized membrane protein